MSRAVQVRWLIKNRAATDHRPSAGYLKVCGAPLHPPADPWQEHTSGSYMGQGEAVSSWQFDRCLLSPVTYVAQIFLLIPAQTR